MVHVIITTANITEAYENRKQQYLRSIDACLQYAHLFDSYTILECVSAKESYLDNYNTFYSKETNNHPNKGLNETNHLRAFLMQADLPGDTAIIKLSGRYIIEEPYFFEKVLALQNKFDSMFKNDNDVYVGNGYHTFLYYMKKWLLIETIDSLDFSITNETPIEWDFKNHLMVNEQHIEIDRLGVMAYQGTNSDKIFRC
ncbi:hypothetical protein ACVW0P_001937 [Mucilaginibacter sp. UYNi724]